MILTFSAPAASQTPDDIVIGKRVTFRSQVLNEERILVGHSAAGMFTLYNLLSKPEFFEAGTLEEARSHYAELTKKYGFEVKPPKDILNTVERRHLRNKESDQAKTKLDGLRKKRASML